ncbi:glycoside hydrolase family 3 N-terminal domain-containing protein [Blastococcus sp. SYSU DS0619]
MPHRLPRSRSFARAAVACALLTGCTAVAIDPVSSTTELPAPVPSSPADRPVPTVAAALDAMDRRAQVAQLFVAGVPLDDLAAGAPLVEQGVGGVFLAGRSSTAAGELAATTAGWQDAAPGPTDLWIAVDQEGGQVQTLRGDGFTLLPSAVEQGQLPADQLAALAEELGASLSSAGLNLDLAPVADVVPPGTEAGNEPIGFFQRQYGGTGPEVAVDAAAVADGLGAHGVTPTLKHFPGLGRVRQNTDTSDGVVDPVTAAGDEQVSAFAAALAHTSADPFVMVSSATYPRIDPDSQAVFSRAVVTDLLRGELGFDGVVITDDVANAAAMRDIAPGERAVRFLAAGGTLVLSVDGTLVPEMVDAVLARADVDPAFAATVDAAVRTALTAKAEAGLLG